MDFQQHYLTLNTRVVDESDLERVDSHGSSSSISSSSSFLSLLPSSHHLKDLKSSRGKVPPSPVSVLNAFSRCSSALSSRYSSNNLSSLDSIDEVEDNTLVPVYSRQSSSRSLMSNDSSNSASSVDWLNCYARSILVPESSRDSSPIKEAASAPSISLTGSFAGRSLDYPKRSRKQLSFQLDELIDSMDEKIRMSIEDSRKARESSSFSPAKSAGSSPGYDYDDFFDNCDEEYEFSDSEEFILELSDGQSALMQSMEKYWWYGGM